ncbi:unnamed protein product [Rotaria magnacalcarata]|uniref:Fucosyltransferase n=1 Tax=Rotaria magnacalcarata TaxID=392030 RepID=A0A820E7L1_9BILA|nr:unnamed protein product [Rotaria magnacalcarata]CAF2052772.1 unnamed protein product [Rotaria magnacalcarata]CAF3967202.1 unnamed protein product [Rotaria magnacalcarata]CAF4242627.1 unnamed protein product [Rotaria magnacalcarata]
MTSQQCFWYIIYTLAFFGFISKLHYEYQHRIEVFSVLIEGEENKSVKTFFMQKNLSISNPLLKYIQQCPECFLFLLTKKNLSEDASVFGILNQITISSEAIFYPLTMKLYYNKPIPYYTILSNNPTELTIRIRNYWIDYIKNFNNIKQHSILYFILQSLQKPVETTNHPWPNKTKLILYYTKFFGSNYWYNANEQNVYANDLNLNNCPISVNACYVTIDHKLFSQSDASLIHLRESINYQTLNKITRRPDQRFVFFLKESPMNSPILSSGQYGRVFNYTQTYRPDSDVTATTLRNFFWLFNYKIYPNYDLNSIIETKVSGKILVAIISNCGGSSNRLQYINELKKYISVDVYGKCGKSCSQARDCHQYAYTTYKFYLAFENSLCDEYVTEKFFMSLESARIVPVVLGWARYDHYIPSSGYIDVRNFATPRQLAVYIDYLDKNTTAYLEYFHWRQYAIHIKIPKYICELCLKLFLDDRHHKKQSLQSIDQYWNRKMQCHRYWKDQTAKTTSLFMAENSVYHDDSEIDSLNADSTTMDIYDDVTVSTDSSTLIFNLCSNMAKKIKDQAVNTIEHTIVDTSSTT